MRIDMGKYILRSLLFSFVCFPCWFFWYMLVEIKILGAIWHFFKSCKFRWVWYVFPFDTLLSQDPPEDAVVTVCGHVFCNQCISEHLNGDDNVCPSANCKVHLSRTKVFSSAALKSALSGLPVSNICSNDSHHEVVNAPKQVEECLSSDSSKIKAALQILQSLPKCQSSSSNSPVISTGEPTGCLRNAYTAIPDGGSMGIVEKYMESDNNLTSQVTEKAIVFSQWTRMLDLLEVPLKDSCIQYRRLDGTMSVAAREKAVKDFNTRPEVCLLGIKFVGFEVLHILNLHSWIQGCI